ncbi:hypothetical protein [Halorarius halobius]|uniref:hypothetical protein n=1 Tax=Halorarius halobius TaxID=2962671 RepID=UPI0020CBFE96|nr:hypothetical protein [Halorarius halobius]
MSDPTGVDAGDTTATNRTLTDGGDPEFAVGPRVSPRTDGYASSIRAAKSSTGMTE